MKNSALKPVKDRSSLICLCPACLENYKDAGYYRIRRANYRQAAKDTCTYCQTRMGYDYYITSTYGRR